MALFLGQKARDTRAGPGDWPTQSRESRIALAVSELDGVSSESIGDAFEKTVIISAPRRAPGRAGAVPERVRLIPLAE